MITNEMNGFFKELFDYHHEYNLKLITELSTHELYFPIKTRDLFCHVLNAHQIWNARICGESQRGVWDTYPLSECTHQENSNYYKTHEILSGYSLKELINYTDSKGNNHQNTVRDILFQVVNHTTHHRAQIIAEFKSAGLQPFPSDYILYVRKN